MSNLINHGAYKPFRITNVSSAMKNMVCNFCGRSISIGDSYTRFVGLHEGSFVSLPVCNSCISHRLGDNK